jgi:TolB-like protein
MSRGPDDEYFADGLTEEILNSLTRLPELLVTARTSSFHFKGKDIPIPEIASTLGVAHVVEGSVRRDGDRLRITAQLIRAADGFHLWSENYDRDSQDTFGVQTDIAEKIAVALKVVMDDEQREEMRESGVRNPEAFVAFQKGVELFDAAHGSANVVEGLLEANQWFDLALQIEPDYVYAYLNSADYFTHILMDSIDDEDITDKQRTTAMENTVRYHESAARHASNEGSRAVAAYDLAVITGQWRKLPAIFDDLLAAPDCTYTSWSLQTTVPFGRAADALAEALAEAECDPMGFNGWVGVASASIYLGDYKSAIDAALTGLEISPHIRIYQMLFAAYLADGRFAEAEAVIDRHVHRPYQSAQLRAILSAARGDAELARVQLIEVLELAPAGATPPIVQLAVTGDREAANAEAARVDAHPNGHLVLMLIPVTCRCGAPFDLEATPNFAKLIEAADFPWPPESPIDWPLKDW